MFIKGIFIFLFFNALGFGAIAQKLSVEIIAQPQFTSVLGDYNVFVKESYYSNGPSSTAIAEKKNTFKLAAGIMAEYNFSNHFSAGLGIFYSQQGQQYKDFFQSGTWYDMTASDWTQENRTEGEEIFLSYLKLPLQVNYYSDKEKKICFSLHVGFYLGDLTSYKFVSHLYKDGTAYQNMGTSVMDYTTDSYTTTMGTTTVTTYTTTSSYFPNPSSGSYSGNLDSKPFNSFDVGITSGMGINWILSERFSLFANLTYDRGFIDIKKQDSQVTDQTTTPPPPKYYFWGDSNSNRYIKFYNSLFAAQLGVRMNLK